MGRPSWDEYFVQVAKTVATRSSCPRKAVGAVIVERRNGNKIVSVGYNGAPRDTASCLDVGCHLEKSVRGDGTQTDHCLRAVHAEMNALLFADGRSVRGCVAFVTAYPCWHCARALYQAGIAGVVYDEPYGGSPHPLLVDLLSTTGFYIEHGKRG